MRAQTIYTTNILSFTSISSAIDLGQSWDTAYLCIQSMTSNSQHHLQASDSLAGTYRRVFYPSVGTSTVASNAFAIASATSTGIVPIPQGLRFIKIETTAILSGNQAYTVIVSGG